MDHRLSPGQQDAIIQDALETYPLADMPREITAEVMARILTLSAPRRIRLAWTDAVLAVILSLCAAALWFTINQLPPIVVAQIRKESILFYQYLLVNSRWLVPAVAFGLAGFLAALTIPYLKQELAKGSA